MEEAMVILITGLVVVFSMLAILIGVIKLYSTIIGFFEKNVLKKKAQSQKQANTVKTVKTAKAGSVGSSQKSADKNTISAEVVAAIAAAVAYLEGDDAKICQIQKASENTSRSTWGLVAQMELTRPF